MQVDRLKKFRGAQLPTKKKTKEKENWEACEPTLILLVNLILYLRFFLSQPVNLIRKIGIRIIRLDISLGIL